MQVYRNFDEMAAANMNQPNLKADMSVFNSLRDVERSFMTYTDAERRRRSSKSPSSRHSAIKTLERTGAKIVELLAEEKLLYDAGAYSKEDKKAYESLVKYAIRQGLLPSSYSISSHIPVDD